MVVTEEFLRPIGYGGGQVGNGVHWLGCEESNGVIVGFQDSIGEIGGPVEEAHVLRWHKGSIAMEVGIEEVGEARLSTAAKQKGLGVAVIEACSQLG